MKPKRNYPSDLTQKQWKMIEEHFTYGKWGNRAKHEKEQLVNAVFYLTKTGCRWRQMPGDFPFWKTVYSFYRRAKPKGIWEKVMPTLVTKSRQKAGKSVEPTYSIIDSQSVKTTGTSFTCGSSCG